MSDNRALGSYFLDYLFNLVSSFEEGGQTPFQALFNIPADVDSILDFINYQSNQPSPWGVFLGLEQPGSGESFSEFFGLSANDTQGSNGSGFIGPMPSNSLDLEDVDAVAQSISDGILNAVSQQQTAAQTSADRAMDFSRELFQQEADFNSAEAEKNRAFQRELNDLNWERYLAARGSEYQTAMKDMQKAGLNPKLVAQLGGASTSMPSLPGGSQASVSAPSGISANMAMANLSPLAQVLSTYISGADALDRQQNDFVKDSIENIFDFLRIFSFVASRGSSGTYLPF